MKKARAWLDSHGVAYDFHDYKTAGIAKDKLKGWSDELGWETLLNRAGTTFRKLPDSDKEGLNERKALALDAGAAVDDQAAGARSRRQIAGRVQAGNLREGSGVEARGRKGLVEFDDLVGRRAGLGRRRRTKSRSMTALIDDHGHGLRPAGPSGC